MLWIGIVLLLFAVLAWLAMFAFLYIRPKLSFRWSIGGGTVEQAEQWVSAFEEVETPVSDHDLRVLKEFSDYGGTLDFESLEALTKEGLPTIAERLRRLEAIGYIVRTASGRYELTEAGRRAVEMYREKLALRRREEELVEQG